MNRPPILGRVEHLFTPPLSKGGESTMSVNLTLIDALFPRRPAEGNLPRSGEQLLCVFAPKGRRIIAQGGAGLPAKPWDTETKH